jgi:hypothetical protein
VKLQHVAKRDGFISQPTKLLDSLGVIFCVFYSSGSGLVDLQICHHHYRASDESSTNETDFKRMAQDVARAVLGSVEIGGHSSCKIADSDLQRHAGRSLVRPGQVVG